MVTAGDLSQNLSKIVTGYIQTQRKELKIVAQLSKHATLIRTTHNIWCDNNGADDDMMESFRSEFGFLRIYCRTNLKDIISIFSELAAPVEKFVDMYNRALDNDEADYFDYMCGNNFDFLEALEKVLFK